MRRALGLSALVIVAALALEGRALAQDFTYHPPGDLLSGSGEGRVDETVYAPGMRFPIKDTPSFANSQVYMHGGSQGPGGGQCDAANYSYPWRDNYCEIRQWDMPLCPSGTGHQGQDIRGPSCEANVHDCVAAVDGTITNVGSYSVYLTAADGTRYDYLHMGAVTVDVGDEVKRGDVLGKVSNEFGGTPTTIHLHFNLRQSVAGIGTVYVPPYMSLVASYQELLPPTWNGVLEGVDCARGDDAVFGYTWDPTFPELPSEVRLAFGGELGEAGVKVRSFSAGETRDDLCAVLGGCEHGFSVMLPLSLLDGQSHELRAYGSVLSTGDALPLEGSPLSFGCEAPAYQGVRRPLGGASGLSAWKLDAFWDELPPGAPLTVLADGPPMGEPVVVRSGGEHYVLDRGVARKIESAEVAERWRLDLGAAEDATAELTLGPPLRPRPVLLREGGELYLLDDDLGAGPPVGGGDGGGGATGGQATPKTASCACEVRGARGAELDGSGLLAMAGVVLGWAGRRGKKRPSARA